MRFQLTGLRRAALVALVGVVAVGSAGAQTPPAGFGRAGQPPGGMGAAGAPRYDPATVTTVQGTLIAVDTVLSMAGIQGTGLHATLKTDKETLPIHLGPTIYLTTQKVSLVKGDKVTITGSKVAISTVPTILAASIVKGPDTLALRDANGMPLWRGIRRR